MWGTLPLLIYGASRRYLQGVGQVRVITVTYVAANLVNWFGNWVLIYGKLGMPAMGVNGSALSTVFARVIDGGWRCWALRGGMSASAGIRCFSTGPDRRRRG